MADPARRRAPATLADLLAIPEEQRRHEIIDGELVQKAMPKPRHGFGQISIGSTLHPVFGGPPGSGGPGGWWIIPEMEILLAPDQIYRPDLSGWRRERLPRLPDDSPITLRPDWVCEILSPSNKAHDTIRKRHTYHRFEVPHFWILDPMRESLTVLRWTPEGYLIAAEAARGQRLRAEPFDAIELDIDKLFPDPTEP
ncbi:Uma2 family endonuclease [Polyangium sp. 15x6]|uniref:Uma2 family endonuclease n=1 Tax=Polyangium sp. 15x6 TaxID=3042687 RepID=UPI00249A4A91|nr:Uma2 family endonuclease [Polyangium sp. 15x6]MDI3282013.1 Uma2 family endonuclease [Polyangium sp. 15x6]